MLCLKLPAHARLRARSAPRSQVKRSVNGGPNKATTKKDGAGGKGTWGKAGTEHEDVNDPINYDSGGARTPPPPSHPCI